MERHTMQDGTIPLSGLSPSAVSRQWGRFTANINRNGTITFPVNFVSQLFAISAQEVPLYAQANGFDFQAYSSNLTGFKYRWDDQSGNHNGDGADCIINVLAAGI